MVTGRDGHVRVLPVHVANKIAAGEVVERPASVVKELVENSIDAGADNIKIVIEQGGRKLIQISDDGIGMTKDDALLSLERQATSKIFDVDDIENIDTLGFRGEAIPSIASVSRFSITTRTHDSDEATFLQVDTGTLVQVSPAGAPPGTTVEVKDLFCNVPARRKFLRAAATEEGHIKRIFTIHALAHPGIGFTLVTDGHEFSRLAPAKTLKDRVFDLFGSEMNDSMLKLKGERNGVKVTGLIERPNLAFPTRRDQYVFVNGRPATAPSIQYAIKEAYPSRQGDVKPAAIIFIELSPSQVDVNVHPTKREVRFRDNSAVKLAVMDAIDSAVALGKGERGTDKVEGRREKVEGEGQGEGEETPSLNTQHSNFNIASPSAPLNLKPSPLNFKPEPLAPKPIPQPIAIEFALDGDSTETKPWQWFKYLASMDSGFILLETDLGLVTLNPKAARERIVFEQLLEAKMEQLSQQLLLPETIKLSPPDFARINSALKEICSMGFQVEEFGENTIKVDAIPQSVSGANPAALLLTIAEDLAEGGIRRSEKWREEVIARSVAKTFAGASLSLTKDAAVKLVEELASCKTPYISPRGKPTMIFTSSRELARKFNLV